MITVGFRVREFLSYFVRLFFPGWLYAYSTKVRIPSNSIDFRKLLIAKYLLKNGDCVVDGGAHVGYYTRCFSELVGETGKVWSFEPNPYVFKLLHKYARYKTNIATFPRALSDQSVEATTLFLNPYSLSQDSTIVGHCQHPRHKKITVQTNQLDDFLGQFNKLKLIKLDVEGHEAAVVRGAKNVIRQFLPWVIFEYVQTDERNDAGVLTFFKNEGYLCFDLATLDFVESGKIIPLTDIVAFPKKNELEAVRFLKTLSYY